MNGLSPRSILSEQVDVLALKQRAQASSRRVGKYEAEFWAQQWQQQLKEGDDMLFFVDNPDREKTEGFADVGPGFFVRRKGGASVPRLGCEEIDWESTFFLNVICNAFEFKLVVTARGKDPTVIVEKCASVVFASPHLAAAAESKEQQRCSFPLLSFQVHDYASVGSVTMCAERTLGVELFARGTLFGEKCQGRVFSGSLTWDQVREGFARHQPGGWWSKAGESHIALKGPGGRGEASLVVLESEQAAAGKGWFAAWKKAEVISLKCMVSHVSLHFRDIADVFT